MRQAGLNHTLANSTLKDPPGKHPFWPETGTGRGGTAQGHAFEKAPVTGVPQL